MINRWKITKSATIMNDEKQKKSTSTKLARLASTSFECIRINNNLQYSMIKLIRDGETDGLK